MGTRSHVLAMLFSAQSSRMAPSGAILSLRRYRGSVSVDKPQLQTSAGKLVRAVDAEAGVFGFDSHSVEGGAQGAQVVEESVCDQP